MKKVFLFAAAMLVGMTFASCGNGSKESKSAEQTEVVDFTENATEETTEAKPAATETHLATLKADQIVLPSQLKGSVEIVPDEAGNVYCDFNDYDSPEVSITFKLTKKVNTASLASEYGQMWIVGHAQEENGRDIKDLNPKTISSKEWRTGDSDGKDFKEFLEGEVGNTITLDFTGESNIELFEKDSKKIEEGKAKTTEAAKKFGKFKLSLTK